MDKRVNQAKASGSARTVANSLYDEGPRNWEEALASYVQVKGSLTEHGRDNVRNILNQRIHNERLLRNGVIWIIMFILFLVLLGPSVTTVIFLLTTIGLWVAAFLCYRKKPHNSLMWLMPAMVCAWSVNMLFLLVNQS